MRGEEKDAFLESVWRSAGRGVGWGGDASFVVVELWIRSVSVVILDDQG